LSRSRGSTFALSSIDVIVLDSAAPVVPTVGTLSSGDSRAVD